jgi:hypothetical protein
MVYDSSAPVRIGRRLRHKSAAEQPFHVGRLGGLSPRRCVGARFIAKLRTWQEFARIVQERAIEFARENAERELAHANDVQEIKACARQTQELGRFLARNIPAFGRTIAMP